MYITKYRCVFLKLGESIYMAMDLIPILLGSLPLAHNAQHSLVIGRAGASPPSPGAETATPKWGGGGLMRGKARQRAIARCDQEGSGGMPPRIFGGFLGI